MKVVQRNKQSSADSAQVSYSSEKDSSSGYLTAPASDSASEETMDSSPASLSEVMTSPGCGCGKCSIHRICTEGCPKPNHSVQLPILTSLTMKMASVEQFRLECQREMETKDINGIFAGLVLNTCESMNGKTTVVKVTVWLKQLEGCYNAVKNQSSSLLADRMDAILNAECMEMLFVILSEFWSWYNYSLLEKIIHQFGDQDDQRRLQQYKREFAQFSKLRIHEFSHNHVTFGVGGGKGRVEMLLKVDKNWEEIHINQLSAIQQSVSSILGARYHALYLASVSRGCILLKFMVPASTMNVIFPLSSMQKKLLEDAKVMMLKCGRYKYRFSPTTGFHRLQV